MQIGPLKLQVSKLMKEMKRRDEVEIEVLQWKLSFWFVCDLKIMSS
jgi:hypothetical protein